MNRPRPALASAGGLAAAALAALLLGACGGGGEAPTVPGASAPRGRALITYYGCGACHRISGIDQADGRVGPSLEGFAERRYVSGRLAATPASVAQWIVDPQRYLPQTIMPTLGVTPGQARDIVAYLYRQ